MERGPSAPLFFKQLKLALGEGLPVVMVSCYVFEFVGGEGPSAPLFLNTQTRPPTLQPKPGHRARSLNTIELIPSIKKSDSTQRETVGGDGKLLCV